jgi:hypothetical protein
MHAQSALGAFILSSPDPRHNFEGIPAGAHGVSQAGLSLLVYATASAIVVDGERVESISGASGSDAS